MSEYAGSNQTVNSEQLTKSAMVRSLPIHLDSDQNNPSSISNKRGGALNISVSRPPSSSPSQPTMTGSSLHSHADKQLGSNEEGPCGQDDQTDEPKKTVRRQESLPSPLAESLATKDWYAGSPTDKHSEVSQPKAIMTHSSSTETFSRAIAKPLNILNKPGVLLKVAKAVQAFKPVSVTARAILPVHEIAFSIAALDSVSLQSIPNVVSKQGRYKRMRSTIRNRLRSWKVYDDVDRAKHLTTQQEIVGELGRFASLMEESWSRVCLPAFWYAFEPSVAALRDLLQHESTAVVAAAADCLHLQLNLGDILGDPLVAERLSACLLDPPSALVISDSILAASSLLKRPLSLGPRGSDVARFDLCSRLTNLVGRLLIGGGSQLHFTEWTIIPLYDAICSFVLDTGPLAAAQKGSMDIMCGALDALGPLLQLRAQCLLSAWQAATDVEGYVNKLGISAKDTSLIPLIGDAPTTEKLAPIPRAVRLRAWSTVAQELTGLCHLLGQACSCCPDSLAGARQPAFPDPASGIDSALCRAVMGNVQLFLASFESQNEDLFSKDSWNDLNTVTTEGDSQSVRSILLQQLSGVRSTAEETAIRHIRDRAAKGPFVHPDYEIPCFLSDGPAIVRLVRAVHAVLEGISRWSGDASSAQSGIGDMIDAWLLQRPLLASLALIASAGSDEHGLAATAASALQTAILVDPSSTLPATITGGIMQLLAVGAACSTTILWQPGHPRPDGSRACASLGRFISDCIHTNHLTSTSTLRRKSPLAPPSVPWAAMPYGCPDEAVLPSREMLHGHTATDLLKADLLETPTVGLRKGLTQSFKLSSGSLTSPGIAAESVPIRGPKTLKADVKMDTDAPVRCWKRLSFLDYGNYSDSQALIGVRGDLSEAKQRFRAVASKARQSKCYGGIHTHELILAIRAQDVGAVEARLHRGVDVNDSSTAATPLMYAAAFGTPEILRLLIAHGADIEQVTVAQPLHFAASFGREDLCKLLVDAGAEMVRSDCFGDIPQLAAQRRKYHCPRIVPWRCPSHWQRLSGLSRRSLKSQGKPVKNSNLMSKTTPSAAPATPMDARLGVMQDANKGQPTEGTAPANGLVIIHFLPLFMHDELSDSVKQWSWIDDGDVIRIKMTSSRYRQKLAKFTVKATGENTRSILRGMPAQEDEESMSLNQESNTVKSMGTTTSQANSNIQARRILGDFEEDDADDIGIGVDTVGSNAHGWNYGVVIAILDNLSTLKRKSMKPGRLDAVIQALGKPSSERQSAELQAIADAISHVKPLRKLTGSQQRELCRRADLLTFQRGEDIVKAGDQADHFFVILSGNCDVYVPDRDGNEYFAASLEPGHSFGELAFMDPNRARRTASVHAKTDTMLVGMGKAVYNAILRRVHEREKAAKLDQLDKILPKEYQPSILAGRSDNVGNISDTLAAMDASKRASLAEEIRAQLANASIAVMSKTFQPGEQIAAQGTSTKNVYIIVKGTAQISTKVQLKPSKPGYYPHLADDDDNNATLGSSQGFSANAQSTNRKLRNGRRSRRLGTNSSSRQEHTGGPVYDAYSRTSEFNSPENGSNSLYGKQKIIGIESACWMEAVSGLTPIDEMGLVVDVTSVMAMRNSLLQGATMTTKKKGGRFVDVFASSSGQQADSTSMGTVMAGTRWRKRSKDVRILRAKERVSKLLAELSVDEEGCTFVLQGVESMQFQAGPSTTARDVLSWIRGILRPIAGKVSMADSHRPAQDQLPYSFLKSLEANDMYRDIVPRELLPFARPTLKQNMPNSAASISRHFEITTLGPGQVIGDVECLMGIPNWHYGFKANTHMEVLYFNRSVFLEKAPVPLLESSMQKCRTRNMQLLDILLHRLNVTSSMGWAITSNAKKELDCWQLSGNREVTMECQIIYERRKRLMQENMKRKLDAFKFRVMMDGAGSTDKNSNEGASADNAKPKQNSNVTKMAAKVRNVMQATHKMKIFKSVSKDPGTEGEKEIEKKGDLADKVTIFKSQPENFDGAQARTEKIRPPPPVPINVLDVARPQRFACMVAVDPSKRDQAEMIWVPRFLRQFARSSVLHRSTFAIDVVCRVHGVKSDPISHACEALVWILNVSLPPQAMDDRAQSLAAMVHAPVPPGSDGTMLQDMSETTQGRGAQKQSSISNPLVKAQDSITNGDNQLSVSHFTKNAELGDGETIGEKGEVQSLDVTASGYPVLAPGAKTSSGESHSEASRRKQRMMQFDAQEKLYFEEHELPSLKWKLPASGPGAVLKNAQSKRESNSESSAAGRTSSKLLENVMASIDIKAVQDLVNKYTG